MNNMFFKVLTVAYLFFSMGFSYEAFSATDNSRMFLYTAIAVYFIFRTTYMYERSKEVKNESSKT
jgi:hypothetical protein